MKFTNPVWKTYKRLRHLVRVIQGVHVFTLNQSFSYIYVGGKILIYTTLIIRIFNQSYTGIQSYLSSFFFFKCNSILNYQNTKRRYQILPIKKLHTKKNSVFNSHNVYLLSNYYLSSWFLIFFIHKSLHIAEVLALNTNHYV